MLTKRAEMLLEALRQTKEAEAQIKPPFIHVSEAISTAASFYERVRNLVDFRAEHLLRKAAIHRILKRRVLFMGQRDGLAESLVRELIRARHLPNDRVPESRITEVEQILNKYLALIDLLNEGRLALHPETNWLIEMGAVEIEEVFSPHFIEHAEVQVFTTPSEITWIPPAWMTRLGIFSSTCRPTDRFGNPTPPWLSFTFFALSCLSGLKRK
ncbi:MAG: hypothetical protein V1821_02510 [bacterium]